MDGNEKVEDGVMLAGIEDTPGFTGDTPTDASTAAFTNSSSTDWSSIASLSNAFSNLANSALSIYKQTQSPGVIPGSSLVYNPASGQIINPAAVTVGALGTAASSTLGSISLSTIALVGLGLVGVIVLMSSKRR
jgi:hypothetical protein